MELNEVETLVLSKLISFVKNECDDSDATMFASSTILATIEKKIMTKNMEYLNQKFPESNYHLDHFIEDFPHLLARIAYHISNIKDWKELDLKTKTEIVTNLISPYHYQQITFDSFIS